MFVHGPLPPDVPSIYQFVSLKMYAQYSRKEILLFLKRADNFEGKIEQFYENVENEISPTFDRIEMFLFISHFHVVT